MTIIVVEMPLLAPGITCIYCGKPINDSHVYSVEGHKYRCKSCAGKLVKSIEELRNDSRKEEVCTKRL